MVVRRNIIKSKPKITRITRSEEYIINSKYLGEEPSFESGKALNSIDYIRALNWYNYMCSINEAREYLTDYFLSNNRHDDIKNLNRVSDTWVSTTAGWISRLLSKGVILPKETVDIFNNLIASMFSHNSPRERIEPLVPRASPQQRIKERTHDIIGDIEVELDNNSKFSLYEWLKTNNIPSIYAPKIIEYYTPWLEEIKESTKSKDVQLKEAYKNFSKKALTERISLLQTIISDAERYGNVAKKTRKPRKPRAISIERKLKSFVYQKEDKEFKIASVNPEKIIGATELWTINTKYKLMTVIRALDRGGLQIKGTTIINVDENNSFTKRMGRKPEYFINKIQNSGKIVLKKVMDESKYDAPLSIRINENTILLRIMP